MDAAKVARDPGPRASAARRPPGGGEPAISPAAAVAAAAVAEGGGWRVGTVPWVGGWGGGGIIAGADVAVPAVGIADVGSGGPGPLLVPFPHYTIGLQPRVFASAWGGSRACHPAPFRAGPVEPRLRRSAPGPPPVRLTWQSTRRCKSPPTRRGSSTPPAAPCRVGVRASAVQPLSIGSAVAVGLCSVSCRRQSIPPSFRQSPSLRRRLRAASAGRPSDSSAGAGARRRGGNALSRSSSAPEIIVTPRPSPGDCCAPRTVGL